MPKLAFDLNIPKGEVPEGNDIAGFRSHVSAEFEALGQQVTRPVFKAPPGVAGIPDLIQWVVDVADATEDIRQVVEIAIIAVSAAKRRYLPSRKATAKKAQGPEVELSLQVTIGEKTLVLPVEDRETLNAFLDSIADL